jgi:hypothetical protein
LATSRGALLAAVLGYGLWAFLGLYYGFNLVWVLTAFVLMPFSLSLVYLGEVTRRLLRAAAGTLPGVYLFLLIVVVYGLWYVNGTIYGFSLSWLALAIFGWPLVIGGLYLGVQGSRRFLRTPRGALLFWTDFTAAMFIFLYPTFGWAAVVVFGLPLLMWWGAHSS